MDFLDKVAFWKKKKEENKVPAYRMILSGEYEGARRITSETETLYARKPFLKLEQLYWSDGIIFNAVNTWVELICSPGYTLQSQDVKSIATITKFLEDIEFKDEILPRVVQHLCIYGNAFCEVVYNKAGTKIVDITNPVDPKSIDFKRDPRTRKPIIDPKTGEPESYVQNQGGFGETIEISGEKILHFKLYDLATSRLGVGLVEPVYWSAIGKRMIDEKVAQQEFRRANPLVLVKVGTPDQPASAEEVKAWRDKLQGMTYKSELVYPDRFDVQVKEFTSSENSLGAAEHFVNMTIAGMGLPKALVTGVGENENRAVLDQMVAVTQRKVGRYQNNISNTIENKIFKKIVELNNYREAPRMVWNEFSPESLTGKIDRLVKEAQFGLLIPDQDLLKQIRRWEELPAPEVTKETLKKED